MEITAAEHAVNQWNQTPKILLTAMVADEIFGWSNFAPDVNGDLFGVDADGTYRKVPLYLEEDFLSETCMIVPQLKDLMGADTPYIRIKADGDEVYGQIFVRINDDEADLVEIWTDTITEALCFLGLLALE